jgi:exonuclease SbcC
MRPIKLKMTAFGPYSSVEIVDFQELEGRNLFLVTGPTGSGKTTVFDAISFAMYGEASGSNDDGKGRTAESLRSQYSKDDVLTEVELDFLLKGIYYSVKRIPKQKKPRARGEGFTDQKPEAELLIGGGESKTVVTGVTKVNEKIESIMGINSNQFRQIMMIPQGEFREMLNADSKAREDVLRKLFDTSLYNQMQTNLDIKAKILSKKIEEKKNLRDHEVLKIEYGSDIDLQEMLSSKNKNIAEIIVRTSKNIEEEKTIIKKSTFLINEKAKGKDSLVVEKEKAKAGNEKLNKRDAVLEEVKKFESRKDEINTLMEKIAMGEKTSLILQIEKNCIDRKQELNSIKKSLDDKSKELVVVEKKLSETEKIFKEEDSKENSAKREKLVENLNLLKTLEDKVRNLENIRKAVEKLEKTTSDIEKKKKLSGNMTEENRKTLKSIQDRHDNSVKAKTKLAETISEYRQCEEIKKKLEKIELNFQKVKKVIYNLNKHQKSVESEVEKLKIIDKEYKKNKLGFLKNQAAVLAHELNEGIACPVCGSMDHPFPAEFSGDYISEDRINELEESVKKQEKKLNDETKKAALAKDNRIKLNEDRKVIIEELASYSESINDSSFSTTETVEQLREDSIVRVLEEYSSKLESIKAKGQKFRIIADEGEELSKKVEALTSGISKSEIEIENLISDYLISSNKLSVEKTKLEGIYSEVPEGLRNIKSLLAKIDQANMMKKNAEESYEKSRETLNNAKIIFEKTTASIEQLEKEEKKLAVKFGNSKKELDEKIRISGFSSFESYENAKMKNEEIKAGKKMIDDYSKELHSLNQQHEKLLLETKDLKTKDIGEFDDLISKLTEKINVIIQERSKIENRMSSNSKIMKEVKSINNEIGGGEKSYSIMGNLARIAQGRNNGMITFERYVLAAFLDDILSAANIRLRKMSQGRYILSRTEELARRNKQSGLELEVFDNYTGKSRHVKTLSGGEGFKASLSMALGLSDVVQSHSGGVQLDTMFIDEGFGTLDQESLDNAVSCLIDLQESGRLVGIISHVQELKERIDTRLEVKSTNTGSTTEFVVM